MAIRVYISGICGSHEVRKQQQRVLFILQSLPIKLEIVDITEPGREEDLTTMQEVAKKNNKKTQLPPQIFNDEDYCGDYADFEVANDDDQIMRFLKLESEARTQNGIGDHQTNGISEAHTENNSDNLNEINAEEVEPDKNAPENETDETTGLEKDNADAKLPSEDSPEANTEVEVENVDVEDDTKEGGDVNEEESE